MGEADKKTILIVDDQPEVVAAAGVPRPHGDR